MAATCFQIGYAFSLLNVLITGKDQGYVHFNFSPIQTGIDPSYGASSYSHLPSGYFGHLPFAITHSPTLIVNIYARVCSYVNMDTHTIPEGHDTIFTRRQECELAALFPIFEALTRDGHAGEYTESVRTFLHRTARKFTTCHGPVSQQVRYVLCNTYQIHLLTLYRPLTTGSGASGSGLTLTSRRAALDA